MVQVERAVWVLLALAFITAMAARGFLSAFVVVIVAGGFAFASLALKKELEETRQADSHVLSQLAHDIKNTLNSVLMAVHSSLENSEPESPEHTMLSLAYKSARFQDRLVTSVQDAALLLRGAYIKEIEDIEVKPFFSSCVDEARAMLFGKEQPVAAEIDEDFPRFVRADGRLLRGLALNLLLSAFKYSPKYGKIRLKAFAGEKLRFEISDDGPRIEPEALSGLFTIGAVCASGGTKIRKGIGLSLYFCRLAAEALGGTVGARNGAPEGFTVWFELPPGNKKPA